jgi:hypothetical protein
MLQVFLVQESVSVEGAVMSLLPLMSQVSVRLSRKTHWRDIKLNSCCPKSMQSIAAAKQKART